MQKTQKQQQYPQAQYEAPPSDQMSYQNQQPPYQGQQMPEQQQMTPQGQPQPPTPPPQATPPGAEQPPYQPMQPGAGEMAMKPHLGISVMPLTRDLRVYFAAPQDRGVLVAHVEPDSVAARSGLRAGDVLIEVENQPIQSASDVIPALMSAQGGRVRMQVMRNGQRMRIDATMPPPPQMGQQTQNPML